MYHFYRSELLDKLINRYLTTYNFLEGKKEPIGAAHKFLMETIYKNIKLDLSSINISLKKYAKFVRYKKRFIYRVEKLDFHTISDEEMVLLRFYGRFLYKYKQKKLEVLNKRFELKKKQYKQYVPLELLNLDNVDVNVKPVTLPEVLDEIKQKQAEKINFQVLTSDLDEGKLKETKQNKEEKLEEKKLDIEVKSEIAPGQISIELDKFFNGEH